MSTTFATTATAMIATSHETIHDKILNERRFVVFNSRRLTGECLSICNQTNSPTVPTDSDETNWDTLGFESEDSTDVNDLTFIDKNDDDHDDSAKEGCLCEVNDNEWEQSWKCGTDEIYVCPNVGDEICSIQAEGIRGMRYYQLSEEQCDTMRSIDVGQPCIHLRQYDMIRTSKRLTDRVCYKSGGLGINGMKQSNESCDVCPSKVKIDFEKEITTTIDDLSSSSDAFGTPPEAVDVAVGGGDDTAAKEGCFCSVDNFEWDQSWRCGKDVYVCPNVGNEICSVQPAVGLLEETKYYSLSDDQCDAMRAKDIGQQCISLPEYGITDPNIMDDRVCYKNSGLGINGMKQTSSIDETNISCDVCPSKIEINFEEPV